MKKYIIISGCSYAYKGSQYLLSLLTPFDVELINIGANSASNEYISESTIIAVKSLLDDGVLSKDILVINNFTQIFRPIVKLPYEYYKKTIPFFDDIDCDRREYRNISYASTQSLLKFKNQIFSFLVSDKNLNGSIKDWYNYQSQIYPVKFIVQQHFEIYLQSIVVMQSFLKKHNICNISFLMNNVFDGWDDEFRHVYNVHSEFNLPKTIGTKHICEISDYTKVLWECIDLESFIFHQTDENRYGGIDEFMLDKYPDRKYLQNSEKINFIFGNHPNEEIYHKFTDEYMLAKLNNWVNEIYS
jgi:hypothetical protein